MNAYAKLLFLVLIIGFFFGYLFFEFSKNLKNAAIEIYEPTNIDFRTSEIKIKGKANNVSFLEINGQPLLTDKDGNFEKILLFPEGLNIIEVKGKDKYGKEISKNFFINIDLN